MGAIAVRLSSRARLTRPLFATAPQYSDTLLVQDSFQLLLQFLPSDEVADSASLAHGDNLEV